MMKTKLAAVAAIAAIVAPSAMAAVRPSVAQNLSLAPVQAGARMGAPAVKKQQNLTGGETALVVAGVAAAGVGIAAAAGAFDNGHSSSP
ncbi:hypothetical protein DMC47_35855 [Nostoc sp. 3335mG]|nr:hypothetical protein DMC47_35855 [Nostoc sp. 3335mG]